VQKSDELAAEEFGIAACGPLPAENPSQSAIGSDESKSAATPPPTPTTIGPITAVFHNRDLPLLHLPPR
jgi:hypothetical protein